NKNLSIKNTDPFTLDTKPIQTLDLTKVDVSQSNMGIAAVVPAEKIRDILFGKDLKKIRGF
ncbi:MAG: hypothetical protein O2857_24640, partial [Planctomycetota bacterium]|nr:hypothetical protein [Planctomycetota bacterium]